MLGVKQATCICEVKQLQLGRKGSKLVAIQTLEYDSY